MPQLASGATSNGNGEWVRVVRNGEVPRIARVWGTWDGATLKFQHSPDYGTTAVDVPDASFTANGARQVFLPTCVWRYVITNAGANTRLNATVD